MVFSKTFPKNVQGKTSPTWVEVFLTDDEEKAEEKNAREENIKLMKQCILDAKRVARDRNLKLYQTDMVNIAISLFEKQASHAVYWKENRAKDKLNKKFKN